MKKLTFDIEPDQGAAGIFAQCALEGHKLIKLERKNRKVTCWYEKDNAAIDARCRVRISRNAISFLT